MTTTPAVLVQPSSDAHAGLLTAKRTIDVKHARKYLCEARYLTKDEVDGLTDSMAIAFQRVSACLHPKKRAKFYRMVIALRDEPL